MTWPLPDRPKLPPAPTREDRQRARQVHMDAIDADPDQELPRGVSRGEDGSWHTSYWRRDDVWIVGGMILSFVLLVAFLAYWTSGAPAQPEGRDQSVGTGLANGRTWTARGELTPFWWGVAILILLFVVGVVGFVVWSLVKMLRDRGPRYEDLAAPEQARRREVARLLKQVEPPVSVEDAERQLGHVPPDDP